jgi:hypothetical protein
MREGYKRIRNEVLHFFTELSLLRLPGLFSQCYSRLGTRVLGKIC